GEFGGGRDRARGGEGPQRDETRIDHAHIMHFSCMLFFGISRFSRSVRLFYRDSSDAAGSGDGRARQPEAAMTTSRRHP
ncbi:hypothetical protein, partial [Burkholderia multivorans]|uniref:hypothetical protein n=1 Tax=Burkholderia multivorans TaxID=87883 RepID=UPI001C6551AA